LLVHGLMWRGKTPQVIWWGSMRRRSFISFMNHYIMYFRNVSHGWGHGIEASSNIKKRGLLPSTAVEVRHCFWPFHRPCYSLRFSGRIVQFSRLSYWSLLTLLCSRTLESLWNFYLNWSRSVIRGIGSPKNAARRPRWDCARVLRAEHWRVMILFPSQNGDATRRSRWDYERGREGTNWPIRA
jgi:hypothetical protein